VSPPADPRRYAVRQTENQVAWDLEKIPGVLAATVWLQDQSTVREIYITGAPGTSLTILERAVVTVLQGYSLAFTTHHLQIVPIDSATVPTPLWQGRFLLLDEIQVERAEQRVSCHVRIIRRGDPFTGNARDIDTEHGRARAAAQATLNAAERATSGINLGLEGIYLLDLFGRRYTVLSIEAAVARRATQLPGIAPITDSVEDAACRATLGAIDRWLTW
jgi:hypothetical protein